MAWSLVALLIQGIVVAQHAAAFPATVIERAENEYDYVVVGGGPAGLVVANRLSENKAVTVLVIESGPLVTGKEEFDKILVEGKYDNFDRNRTQFTWPNIMSGPQEGLNGRYFRGLYGKLVGGGSALNGKIWTRGSARDYDDWARYIDDNGWGWKSLLPYFKKSETFTPPIESYRALGNVTWDMSVHGTDGPIQATYPEQYFPSTTQLIAGEKALGIPYKKDQAAGDPIGAIWTPSSFYPKDYTRSYAARDYYQPVKARPNLHLLAENTVTKILFDGKRAVGVEYATGPEAAKKSTKAKKEVLVAGGAIKSPQLLQISGIGTKKLTDGLGVKNVADLPVGENFQDHSGTSMTYNLTLDFDERMWAEKQNKTWMDAEYDQFITDHTGYYTAYGSNHMVLLSFPMLHGDKTRALLTDIAAKDAKDFLHSGADKDTIKAYQRQMELTYASMATNDMAFDENYSGGRSNLVIKPLSRGFVFANTTNIWDGPNMNHRTFAHPLDMQNLVASLKWTRKLFLTKELSSLDPAEVAPGVAAQSDEALVAYIRQNHRFGEAHGCCTAPMGTVLDSKLRVKGVQGLRVVDISSWPMLPGAHTTQCTAYAVAERAADLIKDTW